MLISPGSWSEWSEWSVCVPESGPCGPSYQGLRNHTRNCSNPTPLSAHPPVCRGISQETTTCVAYCPKKNETLLKAKDLKTVSQFKFKTSIITMLAPAIVIDVVFFKTYLMCKKFKDQGDFRPSQPRFFAQLRFEELFTPSPLTLIPTKKLWTQDVHVWPFMVIGVIGPRGQTALAFAVLEKLTEIGLAIIQSLSLEETHVQTPAMKKTPAIRLVVVSET
eukprot:TCALIF_01885-PA protein Name:"Similar to Unc5c Netrin receptor UNC5C (Rattus norvegicus)" AED:0.36 eAED:0.36 QI:0/0/0/0.4/0.25/0.6/5/0/219